MQSNNDRIIAMAVKANAEGYKSYGKYVEVVEPPRAPVKKSEYPTCKKCGAEIKNPGQGYKTLCDKCRSEAISKGTKAAIEKRKKFTT